VGATVTINFMVVLLFKDSEVTLFPMVL